VYPELRHEDLSNWTYGDKENYSKYKDASNLTERFPFTDEQIKQLEQRGIRLEDTFYLFKDFYQAETILAQPDAVLKETIAGYYQFSLDMLAGGY
jgi:putative salt-induced outer membrane protein YdiY